MNTIILVLLHILIQECGLEFTIEHDKVYLKNVSFVFTI